MPTSPDTYADFTLTTLAGGAGGAGTNLLINDTTLLLPGGFGARYPSAGPFYVLLGVNSNPAQGEVVRCTSRSTDTLTIVRGISGTQQQWPVSTTPVQLTITGTSMTNLWTRVQGEHYNAMDWGAKGDGVTDDRLAIQAMLDACRLAGGGECYFPKGSGNYMVSSTTHPKNALYGVCLVVGANTTLRGAGRAASVIQMMTTVADQSRIILNYNFDTGGDENISIIDMGFDGNAANIPGTPGGMYGVVVNRVRRFACDRVRFKDFYGTAASGAGETFFTDCSLGTDATYTDCDVIATNAHTASGFSANSGQFISYIGCTARGMGVANGFTHNTCAGISYVNCYSYGNAGYGFNSEVSVDVTYTNCHSGVVTANAATYPYAANTLLGNTLANYVANTGSKITYANCHGHRSAKGLWIVSMTGTCQVIGGSYSDNTIGVTIDATSQPLTRISGNPEFGGGTNQMSIAGNAFNPPALPAALVPAVPASGSSTTNTLPFPVRVHVYNGTAVTFGVDGSGNFATMPSSMVFLLYPQESLQLNYTGAPSWVWTAAV